MFALQDGKVLLSKEATSRFTRPVVAGVDCSFGMDAAWSVGTHLITMLTGNQPVWTDYLGVVFSSPEHKVLRVSYCDRSLSVVRRRPSCGVRRASCVNFFT